MTEDPINKEWLISAGYGAQDSKTGLNAANGLQFEFPTSRPPHPGKTKTQRAILDAIGCGDFSPPGHRKTFAKMVELGLLVRLSDKILGTDRFGVISIPQFEMPVHVHVQWCDAVAFTDEEIAEFEASELAGKLQC